MISLSHLITIPSVDDVHSFQCLWLQQIFEKKMEDIVPVYRKNHAHKSVSIKRAEICPMHINFTSSQYKNCRIAIILQFLVDFIQLLFLILGPYFSVFKLES